MSVNVIFSDRPAAPVRAFPVLITEGKKGPVAMRRVLDDKDLMAALIEQAKADLETWRRRYERLCKHSELKAVFVAIDRARGRAKK
jgi:hypothetical protein